MFYQGDIIGIHLEPTSKCNAKCPQCPRNVFGSSHLLDNLQEEDFPIELLDQIDIPVLNDVLINGNYGDIVMHSKPKEFIEALVNNAGVADFGTIEETSFDRWRAVMATNLDGVFLCSQASIPHLKKSRGAIINISSISGLRASTLRTAYGTSKAAVIHLTQQQAAELGEHNIRVNCVAPGPVRTKLAMAVHTPDIVDAYHEAIPLNRYGTETEIAETILFLASSKASYITGQCISVDGGFETTGVGLPSLRK